MTPICVPATTRPAPASEAARSEPTWSDGASRAAGVEPVEVRAQQALERGHVGPDPAGPVGHPGPGRARGRPQAGLGHQFLGPGGQLLELLLQGSPVVAGRRAGAAADPFADPLGHGPGHGPGRPAGGSRGAGGRTSTGSTSAADGLGTAQSAGCARRARALGDPLDQSWGTWSWHRLAMTRPQLGLEPEGTRRTARTGRGGAGSPAGGPRSAHRRGRCKELDGLVAVEERRGRSPAPRRAPCPACSDSWFSTGERLPTCRRRLHRRDHVCWRTRTTPSAALFFLGGSGSSTVPMGTSVISAISL